MNLVAVAEFIGDTLFEAHRGVIDLSGGDFLAFGNDGFAQDERAKREVAAVRSRTAGQATETSELVRQGLFWKESDPISSGSGREAVQRAFSLPASPQPL